MRRAGQPGGRRPVHHGRLLHPQGQAEDRHAHVLRADPPQPPCLRIPAPLSGDRHRGDPERRLHGSGGSGAGRGHPGGWHPGGLHPARQTPVRSAAGALRRPRLPEGGGPTRPPGGSQGPQLPALQPLLLPQQVVLHPGRGERGGGAAPRPLLRQQRHRPETGGGAGARGDPGAG